MSQLPDERKQSSIDLEVLTFVLGVNQASVVSNTPPEILQTLMTELYPENHDFFAFVRDCVITYVNKAGMKTASSMLNVSNEALGLIVESSDTNYTPRTYKKQKTVPDLNIDIPLQENGGEDEIRILEDGRKLYPAGFKRKVVNCYMGSRDLHGTARKFNISSTLITNWLFKIASGDELIDNPGKKR